MGTYLISESQDEGDQMLAGIVAEAREYQKEKQLHKRYPPGKILGMFLQQQMHLRGYGVEELAGKLQIETDVLRAILEGELPESALEHDLLKTLAEKLHLNTNVLHILLKRDFTPTPAPVSERQMETGEAERGIEDVFQSLLDRLRQDPFSKHLQQLQKFLVKELDKTVFNFNQGEMQLPAVTDSSEAVTRIVPAAYQSHRSGINASHYRVTQTYALEIAFEEYGPQLLLLGEPGAGKTTMILNLALTMVKQRLANPNTLLPVYAPIKTWKGEDLLEWLVHTTALLDARHFREEMATGRVLLFLDGLDELVAADGSRAATLELQVDFVRALGRLEHTPMIMTCRIGDYERIVAHCNEKIRLNGAVIVEPLQRSQLERYLKDCRSLWNLIQHDADLLKVVARPLGLRFLIEIYHNPRIRGHLPEIERLNEMPGDMRDMFFTQLVESAYRIGLERDYPRLLPFALAELYQILGEVAFNLYLSARGGKGKEEVEPIDVQTVIGERWLELIDLVMQLYLVVETRKKVYRFIHPKLREHFAFQYALKLLEHGEDEEKYYAIQVLGRIGDQQAVNPLLVLLEDENPSIQKVAVWALTQIDYDHRLRMLLDELGNHDVWIRMMAAQELSKMVSIAPLISHITEDGSTSPVKAVWDLKAHETKPPEEKLNKEKMRSRLESTLGRKED